MATTIYADSWTGSAASGKVTQRAYMTYTVNQTATTYQIIVQSGIQQWNPTWTNIKTVCTLTDQSNVTKTLTQSSGTNHLHQFFNVTYATITKTSSTQSKTITGTSKITGGVDSAHGSGTVLNKTSTVSHVFNIPAELKVSGSTLISKTFSTSEQTFTLAATGGTSPYTFTELGEQGDTNYFSISGSTLKIAANTPAGSHNYRVKIKDADGVSISVNYEIRIAKANISPTVTMANWAYGGTASTPSVSGNTGNGTVTYNYKLKSAADSAYSTTKPSDAGTYTIRASIAATTNYNAGTATKDFSITFTATPTAYSAKYDEAAHSASIKTSAPGTTVSYGTSTSYGYSVTCTNANTNYAMSSVTRTVTGTTTVYYSATKNGYTTTGSTTITISNGTLNITPTAYNAIYNGVAHSASIKCTNTGSVTISYGTSTSYGQTLTATTKGTNYSMANVTRTVLGTTTVYYKASKTYYNDVTGSTTITITGVPVHTNVSGTWKHGAVYLNINGTWKPATAGYVNVNGTWKSINK